MKTKAIASFFAAFAVLLFALFFNHASGKPEASDPVPASAGAQDIPVQHVGMGENQPLR